MRISDWSSDVCSSDLADAHPCPGVAPAKPHAREEAEDRGYGEHYGEPVVFLEQAVARLVVALVKRPEIAVHHPAMGGIGDALHRCAGDRTSTRLNSSH